MQTTEINLQIPSVDIFNPRCETTQPDIWGYAIREDSPTNLLLFVNPRSCAIMRQLAEITFTYVQYVESRSITSYYDPSTGYMVPFKNEDYYILFTGVKDDQNRWIRRSSHKTQEAYIKLFFLLEFLLKEVNCGCDLFKEELSRTLHIDKETLSKILWRLDQDSLIRVNTTSHRNSVEQMLANKSYTRLLPYEYSLINTVSSSCYNLNYSKLQNPKSKQSKSRDQDPISNPTSETKINWLYWVDHPSFVIEAAPPAPLEKAGGAAQPVTEEDCFKVIALEYNLTEYLYTLVSCYDRQLPFDSAYPTLSPIILHRNKQSEPEEVDAAGGNEELDPPVEAVEELHYEYLPFMPYIAPYQELELDADSRSLVQIGHIETLKTWINYHTQGAKITHGGRLWHPFHSLKRDYRKKVHYKGSPLVEVFDISNCFYTLIYKRLLLEEQIPREELIRYHAVIRQGRFYEGIMGLVAGTEIYQERVKSGQTLREIIKTDAQAYRNSQSIQQAAFLYPVVDLYFKYYPSIREFLFNCGTTTNKEGKKVKRIQSEMCRVETFLISQICYDLVGYGVTPFSLHDGIYLSQNDMDQIKVALGIENADMVKAWVKELFWEKYDEMPNELTEELVFWDKTSEDCRSCRNQKSLILDPSGIEMLSC